MKKLLIMTVILLIYSCSNPASPELPVKIIGTLNGTPLELCGWADSENKLLEICTYDSAETIWTIIDDYQVGMHKAFIQYQRGCEMYTASRADVLITSTENDLLSCGISFYVVVNEVGIEGIIKIDNMKIAH